MSNSVMPKGVEHMTRLPPSIYAAVSNSVMPKGVEHLVSTAPDVRALCVEFSDAERR